MRTMMAALRALRARGAGCCLAWLVVAGAAGCRPPDQVESPALTVDAIRVSQYSGGEARLEIDLALDNPNPFEITLTGVDCVLRLDGREIGAVIWSGTVPVRKSTSTPAVVQAALAVGANGDLFTALIDGERLRYALTGEVRLARGVIERRLAVATAGTLGEAP